MARDLSFVARSRAFRSTDPWVKYVNPYIFTCKYKSKKLNTDALLKDSMLRNTYYSEMVNMPSMKNTGKKYVTFLIISEQSHTHNIFQ